MTHYHIRWSDGQLDWQAFGNEAEAEVRAREIVRPGETYTFEKFGSECPRCAVIQTRAKNQVAL